jgi:GTP-binding protein
MNQFVDHVTIKVASGDGGNGMIAWRREKYEPMGGPAGGSGGRGGSVYLVADKDLQTLLDFHYKNEFAAEPGARGGPKSKHGKDAENMEIRVPVGTLVFDAESHQAIADLATDGERVLVAAGGRGGRGNSELASSTHRSPYHCEPGEPGVERVLELELKLLADVGLVGLPNAGKSSLLSRLTAAKPKIASYPFSTLIPNLGVIKKPEGGGYVIADIPGLIEGAHEGVGLGHQFLRHIERTRLLLHLVDISQVDLLADITTINKELGLHSERLQNLPQILVLNKCDLVDEETRKEIIKDISAKLAKQNGKKFADQIMAISCATNFGIEDLNNYLITNLPKLEVAAPQVEITPDLKAQAQEDDSFKVSRAKNIFYIEGKRIERLLTVTDLRSPESIHHFQRIIRAMGVIDELITLGVQPGAEVVIGEIKFTFGENLM